MSPSPPTWISLPRPTPCRFSRFPQSTLVWAPWVMQQILLAICVSCGRVCVSMLLSPFVPSSPSYPPLMPISLFSLHLHCCPANRFINTIFLDSIYMHSVQFSSVTQSLQPHGLQQARPSCPSLTPEAYSNSCPLSWWCHPTILSSVIPFFSWLQSFPASGSFQMNQFVASGSQSIGVSASASVLPMNI